MSGFTPLGLHLHNNDKLLELEYLDGKIFYLSCEYLRVFSPSAEVKGHSEGQEVLQTGKANVSISAIEPVGNYALKLVFDDGHDSGIYTWEYLRELCETYREKWQGYLDLLEAAGASRDPDISAVRLIE
ncbi:DUF971 domain-containing protein [Sansalvadorimonas sp. 2012CJ34-2]|uniref:DUF971 domain-containing protein n=1 Tax=Parendozoicomonas callyspongiae TaxID=2942213 RepID=A0ABT0PLG6_9GAMM|nr:DUF971 domain-containing protein [Sansalvadorimonas sp. 2012CJ34-2]MCL6271826.1 DUF971 domain-containing protein [Sansalvadorimonas sp. 2012CJ34-2]